MVHYALMPLECCRIAKTFAVSDNEIDVIRKFLWKGRSKFDTQRDGTIRLTGHLLFEFPSAIDTHHRQSETMPGQPCLDTESKNFLSHQWLPRDMMTGTKEVTVQRKITRDVFEFQRTEQVKACSWSGCKVVDFMCAASAGCR